MKLLLALSTVSILFLGTDLQAQDVNTSSNFIMLEPMGWTFTNLNQAGSISVYVKLPVMRSAKALPELWVREEFQETMPSGYHSSAALWEFDCGKRSKRRLKSTFFRNNNLQGEIVSQQEEPAAEWQQWLPGTFEDGFWYTACGTQPKK